MIIFEKVANCISNYFLPAELGKDPSDICEDHGYEKLDYLINNIWMKHLK